jgi:inhibitor of KinA
VDDLIKPLGDAGVRVSFGTEISEEVHRQVRAFTSVLEREPADGIIEWVPSYTAVTVFYEPWNLSYKEAAEHIERLLQLAEEETIPEGRTWHLPVCYSSEFAPDLEGISESTGISPDEIVNRHVESVYTVYMLGFTPGFPYLGGMDPGIAVPRLTSPRSSVPAGSVGIAGEQTGVYSLTTPGGWRIIGKTPVKLYDPEREEPVFLRAGDKIRFRAVTKKEYEQIEEEINKGAYEVTVEGGRSS